MDERFRDEGDFVKKTRTIPSIFRHWLRQELCFLTLSGEGNFSGVAYGQFQRIKGQLIPDFTGNSQTGRFNRKSAGHCRKQFGCRSKCEINETDTSTAPEFYFLELDGGYTGLRIFIRARYWMLTAEVQVTVQMCNSTFGTEPMRNFGRLSKTVQDTEYFPKLPGRRWISAAPPLPTAQMSRSGSSTHQRLSDGIYRQ